MAQVTAWLNRASFEQRINLPANFDLGVFDQFIVDLEEIQLSSLITVETLTLLQAWLEVNPYGNPQTPDEVEPSELEPLYKLIVPYLVYAVYAEYVFSGDVQPTDTGLVVKDRESSSSLTDTQRTQLYRNYRDKANARALLITQYLDKQRQSCAPSSFSGETRISSAKGKTRSRFDVC